MNMAHSRGRDVLSRGDFSATMGATKLYEEPQQEEDEESVLVYQILEMVASQSDAAEPHGVPEVSREEVRRIVRDVQGDPSRAFDEVMSLLAIRALRLEEEAARSDQSRVREAKLQWQELVHGLGLSECDSFFRAVEAMPEHERDAALSENGGFFQSLLLQLEQEEREQEELQHAAALAQWLDEQEQRAKQEELHPLEELARMFPDYQLNVIEDVFEAHGFDLEATANALPNIDAVNQVKSFASVLKTSGPTTMWRKLPQGSSPMAQHATTAQSAGDASYESQLPVESLGHFPVLPAKSKQRKHAKGQHAGQYKTLDEFMASHHHDATAKKPVQPAARPAVPKFNAWNTQATSANGGGVMETKLTTDLKLQRLQRLLPSIDRELIRTTFFLNNCSSTATEAALREIFHLPVPEHPTSVAVSALEDDDASPATTADVHVEANPTYAECRARVDNCWHQLSDRYIAALQSFNRNHHIIANDRVREITTGRKALREAQHEAAHAFVTAHLSHIRHHQALDLHGLTVVEALRVAREVIDVCRAERIRRCILITGVGNHSINQKARLLTAIQLSLEHRRIAFRKESGTLYIYPLRAST